MAESTRAFLLLPQIPLTWQSGLENKHLQGQRPGVVRGQRVWTMWKAGESVLVCRLGVEKDPSEVPAEGKPLRSQPTGAASLPGSLGRARHHVRPGAEQGAEGTASGGVDCHPCREYSDLYSPPDNEAVAFPPPWQEKHLFFRYMNPGRHPGNELPA